LSDIGIHAISEFADATLDQDVILASFVSSLKSAGVVCNLDAIKERVAA
jgi:hypothetical protein